MTKIFTCAALDRLITTGALTKTIAMTARTTIPALNASRSPRKANRLGMKPSFARIDDSRGKSAKLVFAARIRIAIVMGVTTVTRTIAARAATKPSGPRPL